MWKFVDERCPRCAIDLTTVEPERIKWRWLHSYSRCPNCGDVCNVVEVEPEPVVAPEPEVVEPAPEPPAVRGGRRRAPEPEKEPEAPAEEPPAPSEE